MKTYKKTHTLKAAHDAHLKKIKANGGKVLSDDGISKIWQINKECL